MSIQPISFPLQPSLRLRQVFGLPVLDMGWADALDFAAGLADGSRGRATLTFFNEASALRRFIHPSCGKFPGDRFLLPSGGAGTKAWARLKRKGKTPVHFRPDRFIPSLLTFMAEPRRIALVGCNADRLERLREELTVHTPWHEIVAATTLHVPAHPFDLVIVDAKNFAEEREIESRLGAWRANLILMAGRRLAEFKTGRPAFLLPLPAGRPLPAAAA